MKQLSKRREKKLARKEADKQVRKLGKEYSDTGCYYGHDDYTELDVPLRRGFQRNLILKPSSYRRSDIEVLESLLPIVNTCHKSNNRTFKSYDKKTGKLTKEFVHASRSIGQKDFDKLTERERAYFSPCFITSHWGNTNWWRYDFIHDNLLISKVSKWFVTRVPILDPDRQSRHQELRNVMYGPKLLVKKVDRLYSNSWSRHDEWDHIIFRKKKRLELKEAYESMILYDQCFVEDYFYCKQVCFDREYWLDIGFFEHYCNSEGA